MWSTGNFFLWTGSKGRWEEPKKSISRSSFKHSKHYFECPRHVNEFHNHFWGSVDVQKKWKQKSRRQSSLLTLLHSHSAEIFFKMDSVKELFQNLRQMNKRQVCSLKNIFSKDCDSERNEWLSHHCAKSLFSKFLVYFFVVVAANYQLWIDYCNSIHGLEHTENYHWLWKSDCCRLEVYLEHIVVLFYEYPNFGYNLVGVWNLVFIEEISYYCHMTVKHRFELEKLSFTSWLGKIFQ